MRNGGGGWVFNSVEEHFTNQRLVNINSFVFPFGIYVHISETPRVTKCSEL